MKQITKFWNWFHANEEAVKNALLLGMNTEEVFLELHRHYQSISKRIGFQLIASSAEEGKFIFIFSAGGYPKLFAKILALEAQAPPLQYFIPQAFIKPIADTTPHIKGEDNAYGFEDYEIKISQVYFSITDYDITTKRLKIMLHVPHYVPLEDHEAVVFNMGHLVIDVLGEIAFRKHIRYFEVSQWPEDRSGLLKLITLQEQIDYLYKVNTRGKTRLI
ncbi:hypothetical protein [Flavobacterium phycosphaerae]|uniref:hypothetical protein n=1 Tax=Flavobacterium phycosphaerae TaxID=2697515 RepID=UPI001389577E|nr:hypothetical protein [Flavobacterium phycosphaerae]